MSAIISSRANLKARTPSVSSGKDSNTSYIAWYMLNVPESAAGFSPPPSPADKASQARRISARLRATCSRHPCSRHALTGESGGRVDHPSQTGPAAAKLAEIFHPEKRRINSALRRALQRHRKYSTGTYGFRECDGVTFSRAGSPLYNRAENRPPRTQISHKCDFDRRLFRVTFKHFHCPGSIELPLASGGLVARPCHFLAVRDCFLSKHV